MSALGQKRTWRDQIAMSALPPESGHWAEVKGAAVCERDKVAS
jgi:hypothetical protein